MKNHWKLITSAEFSRALDNLKMNFALSGINVLSCGTTIKVLTDSHELLENVKSLNVLVPPDTEPSLTLYFIAQSTGDTPIAVDETLDRFLCFGGTHYGRLKSLVSSLGSFHRENKCRLGFHASVFKAFGEGFAIAAPPAAGKSLLLRKIKEHIEAIITDDWCDIEIGEDFICNATQVDTNISVNEADSKTMFGSNPPSRCCICNCGWRRKLFSDLTSFGLPVAQSTTVRHLFFVLPTETYTRDINVQTLMHIALSTAPHSPFSDSSGAEIVHQEERAGFFYNLLKAVHRKDLEIEVVYSNNAQEACRQLSERILSIGHKAILSQLLKAKAQVAQELDAHHIPSNRFAFADQMVSDICHANRQLAQKICNALLDANVSMKTLFVHGSTGKGRGQTAPNIEWKLQTETSISMATSVVANCRDDLDLVCVCGNDWLAYEKTIREILVKHVPKDVDVTLNLVSEQTICEELHNQGTPAIRRVMLLNSPEILYGKDEFHHLWDIASQNFTPLDYAHELDFRTLMHLSGILTDFGLTNFSFSEGELTTVLPSFFMAGKNRIHIGFPKNRIKIKLPQGS